MLRPRRTARRNALPRPDEYDRYLIDPRDPPSIREVADAYCRGLRARQPEGDGYEIPPMAHYSIAEILRETRPGNFLRYGPTTPKFRALKGQLRRRGVRNPLMIEVDRKGVTALGEGHHRLMALRAMYGDQHAVPVRFVYNNFPIETPRGLSWDTIGDHAEAPTRRNPNRPMRRAR